jgi:hypothetical protein
MHTAVRSGLVAHAAEAVIAASKLVKVNIRQIQAQHSILCILQRGHSGLAAVAGRQAFVNSDVCARRACACAVCMCMCAVD